MDISKESIVPKFIWDFVKQVKLNPVKAGVLAFLINDFLKGKSEHFQRLTLLEMQLSLKGYGEWQNKTKNKDAPKFYLKDKRTTVWTKPTQKGYDVFVNEKKINSFSTLRDAKKAMMRQMNQISPWNEDNTMSNSPGLYTKKMIKGE